MTVENNSRIWRICVCN